MKRRVFDILVSIGGVVAIVGLIIVGSLAVVGYNFANTSVHNQLAQQEIFFPSAAAFAHAKNGTEITPAMLPYLSQYAGQQLLTGPEAEAYADHFISIHLSEMPYHGVYSKISAAAQKDPSNPSLKALKQTSFQGTTLRGLLLEAYAFGTFAQLALWAAIVAYTGAFLLAILVAFGFWHAGITPATKEMLVHGHSQ